MIVCNALHVTCSRLANFASLLLTVLLSLAKSHVLTEKTLSSVYFETHGMYRAFALLKSNMVLQIKIMNLRAMCMSM